MPSVTRSFACRVTLNDDLRAAIWRTHEYVNRGVRHYEDLLLELRQEDVVTGYAKDGTPSVIPAAVWQERLIKRQPKAAGHLRELRQLYERLVDWGAANPSSKPARALHSPLVDETSKSGAGNAQSDNLWRPLLHLTDDPAAFKQAAIEMSRNPEALRRTGRRTAWHLALANGQDPWVEKLREWVLKPDDTPLAQRLIAAGVLPLLQPFGQGKMEGQESGGLIEFERMIFTKAVSHLLQHEGWVRRKQADYDTHHQNVADWHNTHKDAGPALAAVRAYEKSQVEVFGPDYRVSKREIRGVKDWIAKHPNEDPRRIQNEDRKRCGSGHVLQWLASNPAALAHIEAVVELNRLEHKAARCRRIPTFTFTDATLHPQFTQIDTFKLNDQDGHLTLLAELLTPKGELLTRQAFTVALDDSRKQLRRPKVRQEGKETILEADSQDNLTRVSMTLGAASLQLSISSTGGFRRAYVKFPFTVKAPDNPRKKEVRDWIFTKGKARPRAPVGIRALGVDLGLRKAASCALIEMSSDHRPVTEQAFALRLPGDKRTSNQRRQQDLAWEDYIDRTQRLHALKDLAAIIRRKPEDRGPGIDDLPDSLHRRLPAGTDATFTDKATTLWKEIRAALSDDVRKLRHHFRQGEQHTTKTYKNIGGKGSWMIRHLERERRFLIAWGHLTPPWKTEAKWQDRETQGTYASRLLAHTNNLKDDRAKTTADMIIQAARGFRYVDGKWVKTHEPVDVIVMEALNGYTASLDRPKDENNQLREWCHRTVYQYVSQQAETYGILITDQLANFTSRFDAETGEPGIRCSYLHNPSPSLVKSLVKMKVPPSRIKENALTPLRGGELFASIRNGELHLTDADLNAAANIAKTKMLGIMLPGRTTDWKQVEANITHLIFQQVG